MNDKPTKDALDLYEEHPLVSLYIGNKDDPESELLMKVHKDWLPAIIAKLKEGLDK